MTDRSKLLAEASSASERLMDFITDKPDWQIPEPKAVISIETATAFAMVYAKERADAEAAAMRERAAIAARDAMCDQEWLPTDGDRQIDEVLAAIRALPATREVGRG